MILFIRANAAGVRFWDPLIGLLFNLCESGSFVVAESLDDILPAIREGLPAEQPAGI